MVIGVPEKDPSMPEIEPHNHDQNVHGGGVHSYVRMLRTYVGTCVRVYARTYMPDELLGCSSPEVVRKISTYELRT